MNKVPTAYVGSLAQKLMVAATVGVIEDGTYKHTYQYCWWAKDEAAFEKAKKLLSSDIETRWMPIKGYLQ